MSSAAASRVRDALADALALVFPVECVGCGAPGRAACRDCTGGLGVHLRERRLPSGLHVWSGLDYDGVAAAALRGLKQDGRTELAKVLAPALSAAIRAARTTAPGAVLVPVPTSRAAMRRRGFRVVELLIRSAGEAPQPLLGVVRTTADQRALGRTDRAHNVAASLRAVRATDAPVIVVDDVLTTGATVQEAQRALTAAGMRVAGAVTAAATPLRGHMTRS